jgi:hypothetical protein
VGQKTPQYDNKATTLITSVFGVALAVGAFHHGFFEFLQGNTATHGILIQAIGQQQRYWIHGTEEAITIIPNFLVTGLLAMAISVFAAVWSVKYINTKHGSSVFLSTFIVLTLVGGGLAQIVFFLPIWAYSTRMGKSLDFWSKLFPKNVRRKLRRIWPFSAALVVISFMIALESSIFGYVPGVDNPEVILAICWSLLGLAWVLIQVSYISGFAYDIERRKPHEKLAST